MTEEEALNKIFNYLFEINVKARFVADLIHAYVTFDEDEELVVDAADISGKASHLTAKLRIKALHE